MISGMDKEKRNTDILQKRMQEIDDAYQKSRRSGFFRDVLTSVRQAKPFRFWKRLIAYFRRLRMISFLFRVIGAAFAFLQTGTLVLLTTALLFVLLPLFLVVSVGILSVSFLGMRKSRKQLEHVIADGRVYVFFALGEFGSSAAVELSQTSDLVCLAVSPHWISPETAYSNRFYLNIRYETQRFYTVRRYFYFYLRKKLLKPQKTTLIY